jgi:zinc transport system substrate-binding protein
VASNFALHDFSRHVAGNRAEVIALVPPGVAPHDWEPSPRDITEARRARLFVYNGAALEPTAERLVAEFADKGPLVLNAAEGLPLLAGDPHVWLDPVLAQRQVEAIARGLGRVDAPGQAVYEGNATAYRARLGELHESLAAGLETCARRDLVTSHAAFAYLARRYRLEPMAVMGLAPEAEPSPQDLARLVRLARARKVKVIFFETLVSPAVAETIAREIGARTLVLNPLEGLTGEEAAAGKDYIALMRANLESLRVALECR